MVRKRFDRHDGNQSHTLKAFNFADRLASAEEVADALVEHGHMVLHLDTGVGREQLQVRHFVGVVLPQDKSEDAQVVLPAEAPGEFSTSAVQTSPSTSKVLPSKTWRSSIHHV